MTVEQAISALLYDHDIVIVPALGAFVRHDESAQVNVITNEFQRPSSTLEFDPAQREENPLIIEYLMEHDSVSDEEARQQIAAFVAQCYSQMRDGQPYTLEGIGTLSLDSLQELCFVPDVSAEFNAEAFGLADLEARPVFGDPGPAPQDDVIRDESKQDIKQWGTDDVMEEHENKKKHSLWWLWMLMLLLLLGGAAFWYFYFRPVEPEPNPPLAVTNTPTENNSVDDPLEIPEPIEITVDTIVQSVDTTEYTMDPLESETDSVPEPMPTPQVIQPDPESKAFIIGGCFGVEEYALNMVATAIEQGCTEAFVMKRGTKFYVSYGQYPTAADAKAALPDIVANYNSKAWILTK